MALRDVITKLRHEEQYLLKQLKSIRGALASLEMGSAVSPGVRRGPGRPKGSTPRRRRRLSAKARAAISTAQKARWARIRAKAK